MQLSKPTLGFIGIGLMGAPMTFKLLQNGNRVLVWNRTPDKLKAVHAAGAEIVENIGALTRDADVVLTCLADTEVVAWALANGILDNGAPGKLLIDLSSIRPDRTREFAEQLQALCGMAWVDAPVSGGVKGAEEGSLAIMAGGRAEDVEIARQVLKPLYRQLTHMGPVGSGQIAKICNQMIVGCNLLVIAEMMALAHSAGVDACRIPEALAGGFADSKPLQITGPEMAEENFEPVKWRVKTLLKDLQMATELAGAHGKSLPMSALAAQLMQLHGSQGFLDQDPATLIKLYR